MPIPAYWLSATPGRASRLTAPRADGRRKNTEADAPGQERTPTEDAASEGPSPYRRIMYAIVALATIAIASTELGTAYTPHERRFYTSAVFQCVAMLAVLQIMLEDFDARLPFAIFGLWAALKYGGWLFQRLRPTA